LPTLTQSSPAGRPAAFRAADVPPSDAPGLYVHVPFCFHKCHYCDFYSITRQTPERMAGYVDLILAEADQWARSAVRVRPRTVFFGGGTPSLLPLPDMRRLLAGLKSRFDFSVLDEWTIEVNPATAALDYCQMLRDAGVDRLSFGAQSFNPGDLKLLERHHDPDDVPRSIDLARAAGFGRLNVDLIYAVPGQDLDSWAATLEAAIALRTPHVSCYGLTYESNTPITVRKRLGQFVAVEDSLEIEMMRHARARLAAAGLGAYEISNYAAPGEACRHNLLYWTGGNYIGLGPSAASHVDGWRWKNRPHLGEWERAVGAGELPAAELEKLPEDQRRGEWVMLRLRLARGVAFDEYAARWGRDACDDYASPLAQLSKLRLIEVGESGFGLSEAGLAVADAVAQEFL
jgi:oxygen-independent coproporphyrinogen III oxidase